MTAVRFCFLTPFYPRTASAETGSACSGWRARSPGEAIRDRHTTSTRSTSCDEAPAPSLRPREPLGSR